jgi:predicted PurR-regulated permease PerM
MGNSRFQLLFFILFVLVVVGLNLFIFLPYFSVLFLALVFTIVFTPLHNRILRTLPKSPSFSALLTTVIILLIIIGPIYFFGTLLFQEASHLYGTLGSGAIDSGATKSLTSLNTFLIRLFPNAEVSNLELNIEAYASKGLSWIIGHMTDLFSGAIKIFFGLLLMLLSLFYFLRDGKKFISSIIELSPLQNVYDEKIVARMILAVNSVVRGNIIIGLIQGVLTGIGFYLFGVPSPALWGTVAAVASLIPSIGTSLVIVPGILFLFFGGDTQNALGLLIWGGVAVGLIDNFLGPVLIKRGIHIHPLLILLSALGGVAFFGPIGFLAGPVSLALLFALFDIYPDIVKSEKGIS